MLPSSSPESLHLSRASPSSSSRCLLSPVNMDTPSQKSTDPMKKETSLSDLPMEMVELILSKLPFSSYIRFAICLNWKHMSPLFYHINMDTPLLLYHKTIGSGIWSYYSPSINKIFRVDCPNFDASGFEFLYAKDGWLLLHNRVEMVLLDPFSGTIHKFPGLKENIIVTGAMFFGSPPNNCTIFIINTEYTEAEACISVYDENGWETETYYENIGYFYLAPSCNPVLCKNRIYCFGNEGNLGVYDPKGRSWTITDATLEEKCDRTIMDNSYLVESSGMLLLVQTEKYDTGIRMFCLDDVKMEWVETYNLQANQSLFLGTRMSTISTVYVDSKLGGRVYEPGFIGEPETIFVEAQRIHNKLYFKPKSIDYINQEKRQNEETGLCYYPLADSTYLRNFGSKFKVYSIWYEPCRTR